MKEKQKRIWIFVVAVLFVAGLTMFLWYVGQSDAGHAEVSGKNSVGTEETKANEGKEDVTDGVTGNIEAESGQNSEKIVEEFSEKSADPSVSVASLTVDDIDGSCVILYAGENQYILVTASHVAQAKPEKVWLAGQEVTVTDYRKSRDYDLAYLVVSEPSVEFAIFSATHIDTKAYEELQEQDEIFIWGVVAGEKVSQKGILLNSWIYIEDFGYHMLWAETENIKGGMSGGGVFDGNGRLLGLLLGSNGKGQIVALPLNIIVGEWKNTDLAGTIDIFSN